MTHEERQEAIKKILQGKVIIKSPKVKEFIENKNKENNNSQLKNPQDLNPNKNPSTLKKINELLEMDTKGMSPEEVVKKQREKATDILVNSTAILDRKNLVALYEVVRGDQELFKDVIMQRMQKNIDVLRESKGKSVGLEEKLRLRTNMELIKIATEMDRFDPSIVYIDKVVQEGSVYRNPKPLTECMTEMAEIYANIGNYDQINVIDDATKNNVGEDVVENVVDNGINSESAELIENIAENLDDHSQVSEINDTFSTETLEQTNADIQEQIEALSPSEAESIKAGMEHPIEMINDVIVPYMDADVMVMQKPIGSDSNN